MRIIPKYRVSYKGVFYEAGEEFQIENKDAEEMKRHGAVLGDPTPPTVEAKKPGRPRRVEHGQSGETEIKDRRG